MKLSRRQIAVWSVPALAAGTLRAQTPAPPLPTNADEELKAARDQNRQMAEALAKFPLPMTGEPATHFKA